MLKYNFFLYLISPFILIRLLIYILRNSINISYLSEKIFGNKNISKKSIWIHCASVGEMKIAIRVCKSLINKGYKDILITSNTPSSKYIFKEANLKNIEHFYLPFDFYFTISRFVKSVSSKSLLLELHE